MARSSSVFVCQSCGTSFPRWQGQCGSCNAWNSLVEEAQQVAATKGGAVSLSADQLQKMTTPLPKVEALSGPKKRLSTGILEFDRVMGGWETAQGVVPGGVTLIGGEPGIGKSTLLTQVVLAVLENVVTDAPVYYVAGEESPHQISMRINRILGIEDKKISTKKPRSSGGLRLEQVVFVNTTDVDELAALIVQGKPKLVIVDSIQTMTTSDLTGAAGSVGQLRESADRLTHVAKKHHVPLFLVGHVTKEGEIAGPKVLEHIVDTVLELSGERTGQLRILRAIKNRFGATDEVGVFRVVETGLAEVSNPSEFFLEHAEKRVPGSATTAVMEGTRPLLVEVQALVVPSQLAMPRRVGRGIELSRIQVLTAVLQKHAHLPLGSTDVFASVAGGFRITEPAVDLGLAAALASSLTNVPLPPKSVFIGEIGLLGEIRAVSYLDRRIKEAKRLGFEHIYSRESHQNIYGLLKQLGLLKPGKTRE